MRAVGSLISLVCSVELTDQSFIQSSTGWHSTITYKSKGYLSGAAHRFTATVSSHPGSSPAHVIEGTWIETSKFIKTSHKQSDAQSIFTDATSDKSEVQVAPIASQGEMESRRVWKDVADGIRQGDFDRAGAAKSKLENEQRARRKAEQAEGTTYPLKNFTLVAEDPACECSRRFRKSRRANVSTR